MASKGGARRSSVEPVDIDSLQGIFDKAVSARGAAAFKLGEYDKKKATTAVSAAGLHQNACYAYTTSQRVHSAFTAHSVATASSQRDHSAFTARSVATASSQRDHSEFTARSQRVL